MACVAYMAKNGIYAIYALLPKQGPMGLTFLKPFKTRPHRGPFSILRPHPKQMATKLTLDDKEKLIYEKNDWVKAVVIVMIEDMWQNGQQGSQQTHYFTFFVNKWLTLVIR